jgi:hypothetical protein
VLKKPLNGYADCYSPLQAFDPKSSNKNVTAEEVKGIVAGKPTIKQLLSTYNRYEQDPKHKVSLDVGKTISGW